jgi:LacI family transcriptional regulator
VSPTAVSFVLNDKAEGRLGAETIEKVRQAIRELAYRPDDFARRAGWRRAASPRTMGIGYLGADLTNSYHGAVIMAAAQEMRREGYHLILASRFKASEEAIEHIRSLHRTEVDGWLLTSVVEREVIDFVIENGVPAVFVGSGADVQGRLPQVRTDDVDGGSRATQHLLALGHRRIAFMAAYSRAAFTRWRFDGYRAALQDAGVVVDSANVWLDDNRGAATSFLQQRMTSDDAPTAFLAMGEALALEVMRALRASGYAVPQDVSVVGYDDTGLAEVADPPLTTVAAPRADLGIIAVRRLKQILEASSGRARGSSTSRPREGSANRMADTPHDRDEPLVPPSLTILPVEFVVRASTGPRKP